jgi:hypothetical protein
MTGYDEWLAANDRYLAESVAWLRGQLNDIAAAQATAEPAATERSHRSRLSRGRGRVADPPGITAPRRDELPRAPADTEVLDDLPPLLLLERRLGLSAFERSLLLLCVAMELDTRIPALCARAQHDLHKPYPTYALALTLFEQPSWDVVSPERPLRYWRLIEINESVVEPLTASALRADERIVNYVKGLNHLDDRLRGLLLPLRTSNAVDLSESQARSAGAIVDEVHRSIAAGEPVAVQLLGGDRTSKQLVAAQAAAALGLHLFEASAEMLPATGAELETFARLWQRESLLLPVGLYLDAADVDRHGSAAAAVRRWLSVGAGVVFVDVREPWADVGSGQLTVDVAKPTAAEQRAVWDGAGEDGMRLSGQFSFDLPVIRRIVREAAPPAGVADDDALAGERSALVWRRCLMESRPSLEQLGQRLLPNASWDDLKLPSEQADLLHRIASQVAHRGVVYDTFGFRQRMNRGLGISVLFAGESGTGKTMAAEVLANELELMLYRIDLSAVVSKYIGETEKNLRKLFDAADDGGVILFFDEADALFGKRSEVKDSHDRYANIEINYLLQRMETFQGLAILATNMKSAMDRAFLRRLRFIVSFPFPGVTERKAMWQQAFPAGTPLADLDYNRLAHLNLAGGSIQNIAVNSAFLAAQAGGELTMPIILSTARIELRKLDKPVNEADFRWLERDGGSA